MASFMDTILRRARRATTDADLEELKGEMEGKVPPDLMNEGNGNGDDMDDDGDDKGIHMHVHLPNGNGGGGGAETPDAPLQITHDPDDEGDPGGGEDPNGGGGAPDINDIAMRLEALEAQVAELSDGGEDEVELQNPGDAQDAKRYIMRRGSRLKSHDDETIPTPEHRPEMIGETDLPGLEDLDARMNTSDSMPQELLWQDTMAKAEIIVPGIRIPTWDSRVKMGVTAKRLCSFRRQTMDAALDNQDSVKVLTDLVGIKTHDQIKSLTCDTLKMAFEATANHMGTQRNNSFVRSSVGDTLPMQKNNTASRPLTLAEINRRNREAWQSGEFKTPTRQ